MATAMATAMAMAMAELSGGSHILVFPYPAQGHMLSLLDLSHHLATRNLHLTILITPNNLPALTPLLSTHPTAISPLLLPLPHHPLIPPGIENLKDLPIGAFKPMMVALGQLHAHILRWFRAHPNPPVAILSDFFLGWTHRLALQLGIPRYVYSPSGAFALSVIFSLWRYRPRRGNHLHDDHDELVSFPNVPNSPEYPWWQLSPIYRSYVEGDPDSEFIKSGFLDDIASWGLVINSFTELERVYVEYLKQELGHDRVFAVGPLLPHKGSDTGGPTSNRVLSWLDTCADHTVVYVCFGSQLVLTNCQMEVVARGLEKSGVRFVWSVKEPTVGHEAAEYAGVPAGFEERVAGRGIVVRGWAPQVAILSHEAVGVFLTHCGWNSIMEAVAAEVLMLTWPMSADQFSNATLLQELKVGIKLCEGADAIPDPDELAELFGRSVSEATRLERERVKELCKAAKEAVGEKGSSMVELDRLVANLSC